MEIIMILSIRPGFRSWGLGPGAMVFALMFIKIVKAFRGLIAIGQFAIGSFVHKIVMMFRLCFI